MITTRVLGALALVRKLQIYLGSWALPILFISTQVGALSPTDLRTKQLKKDSTYILIDIRPPDYFQQAHIQGAESVPINQLPDWKAPDGKQVVVYCPDTVCSSAANAAQALKNKGVPDVTVLSGGMAGWMKAGYPVVRSKAEREAEAAKRAKHMSCKLASRKLAAGSILALDVRPALEFSAGHLAGAVNIPLEELASSLAKLDKSKELLVYDRLPKRSRQAAEELMNAGYAVSELSGGLAAWMGTKNRVVIE